MAVKNKRMGRRKGDTFLATLNDDLRETMALIKDEEAFGLEVDASPKNTEALVERFPALGAQQRIT